ncbi:MAG: hypothetical protein V1701_10320, partial [Planctomycetota bacterium]
AYSSLFPINLKSYGIFGQANVNEETSYGVYGLSENLNSYAGYFKGNVAVEASGGGATSLTLKPGVSLYTQQICLGTSGSEICNTSWPSGTGGSAYWNLGAYNLYPNEKTYNLVVGGTSGADADTSLYVNTATDSLIIGQPSNLILPPTDCQLTCGDGACNNGETGDKAFSACTPVPPALPGPYCDADCATVFILAPLAKDITQNSARISWRCKETHWAKVAYGKTLNYELGAQSAGPAGAFGILDTTLAGLDAATTYFFKVTIWDEVDATYIGDTRVATGSFVTAAGDGSSCPNGTCEAGLGETCATCHADCGCGKDNVCCNQVCHPGECCDSADCGPRQYCCDDSLCHDEKCDIDVITAADKTYPLASRTKADNLVPEKNQGLVLGAVSRLSQSLLVPQANAQTELFKNIIPVAEAAAPFDTLQNRRLTAYGGVISIINGDASANQAMEIGKYVAANQAMGIYSTGGLNLVTNSNKEFIHTANGDLIVPNTLTLGANAASSGDFIMKRGGSCKTFNGNCRALVNPAVVPAENNYLIMNYANDFSGGVVTPGKLYVGFMPGSGPTVTGSDTLQVKNGSPNNSAIYAEQANASGYAGYFSGRVYAGKLGIGTTSMPFRLNLDTDGGILAKGTINSGATVPVSTAGSVMLWYPRKAAFFAGSISSGLDILQNVGSYSTGFGRDPRATGDYSFAAGWGPQAGYEAAAFGHYTKATGQWSFAAGDSSMATNNGSVAMGLSCSATGSAAIALGYHTFAEGANSIALGNESRSTGTNSFASGFKNEAAGEGSVALGRNSFADGVGSVAIGNTVNTGGDHALAFGTKASASHNYSAVFNLSDNIYESRGANSFSIGASGGIWFGGSRVHDIAEMMDVIKSENVQEMELVSVKNDQRLGRTQAAYDPLLVGVVSSKRTASFFMGDTDSKDENVERKPVALVGQVFIKVNNESGEIKLGDPITSSSTQGQGMKALKAGKIIGYAMEAEHFESGSEQEILVFVNVGYYMPEASFKEMNNRIDRLEAMIRENQ